MTRRIALSILVTVWAMLIAAGVTAYAAVRSVLLAELDDTLVARATALPEVRGGAAGNPAPETDRYLVRGEWGQTLGRPTAPPPRQSVNIASAQFVTLADGRQLRSVTIRVPGGPGPKDGPVTIVYSSPADHFNQVMGRLGLALGGWGVVGGLLAAAVATLVARSTLRPLSSVADAVGSIDEGQLDRRIDERSLPPELAPMGRRLNDMLARLEQAFQQRRQFLADASHELRTPVAALVTTLDVTLARRQQDETVWRRALEACKVNARILRQLVERLTEQVHTERAGESGGAGPVWIDLGAFLEECATIGDGLTHEKSLHMVRDLPAAGSVTIRTQPDRLRRALLNLLHNAAAYNRPGGVIRLSARTSGPDALIEVADEGVGIAPDQLPHVFAPFYRVDAARTSTEDGHLGLGLYQVRTDVQTIGGECSIESSVGVGTRVMIHLRHCIRPALVEIPAESVKTTEKSVNPL